MEDLPNPQAHQAAYAYLPLQGHLEVPHERYREGSQHKVTEGRVRFVRISIIDSDMCRGHGPPTKYV